MIQSKRDLYYYLEQDGKGLHIGKASFLKRLFLPNKIHEFQIVLRKTEYHTNVAHKSFFNRIDSIY